MLQILWFYATLFFCYLLFRNVDVCFDSTMPIRHATPFIAIIAVALFITFTACFTIAIARETPGREAYYAKHDRAHAAPPFHAMLACA